MNQFVSAGLSHTAGFSARTRRGVILATVSVAALFVASPNARAVNEFLEFDLVSDISGLAANDDPNLVNPWGIASSASSPFWIADNGSGLSTLYDGSGVPQSLVVTVPPPAGGSGPSAPTGVAFNGGSSFEVSPGMAARFIFATEDGTIAAWNPATDPSHALLKVDNSPSGAVYTGLAMGNTASGEFLYAANFKSGSIDVFDGDFSPVALAGSFTDPVLPSGYVPFNVQNIDGSLYVTYARQDGSGVESVAGAGNGIVDVFDLDGNFQRRLVTGGPLNSPWGLAVAPSTLVGFEGNLLVGNFGDGRINAFDPTTGILTDLLRDDAGSPLEIEGLRGLLFGNGGNGGDLDTLYFTAGIADGDLLGDHGLFGSLTQNAPDSVPDSPLPFSLIAAVFAGLFGTRRRLTARKTSVNRRANIFLTPMN